MAMFCVVMRHFLRRPKNKTRCYKMHIIITDIYMVRNKFAFRQSLARKLKDFTIILIFVFFLNQTIIAMETVNQI